MVHRSRPRRTGLILCASLLLLAVLSASCAASLASAAVVPVAAAEGQTLFNPQQDSIESGSSKGQDGQSAAKAPEELAAEPVLSSNALLDLTRRLSTSIARAGQRVLSLGTPSSSEDWEAQDDLRSGDDDDDEEGHIYLIRHGEKGSGVGLSAAGVKRSHCLVSLFDPDASYQSSLFASDDSAPSSNDTILEEEAEEVVVNDDEDHDAHSLSRHHKHGHRTYVHHQPSLGYLISQNFNADGRRSRPYRTLVPLARALGAKTVARIDHGCEREDARCAARRILAHVRGGRGKGKGKGKGQGQQGRSRPRDVLVSWQHTALTEVAAELGVRGLHYPSKRYDLLFHIHKGQVRSILSQECRGLDARYVGWRATRKTKVDGKRLVAASSWAKGCGEE